MRFLSQENIVKKYNKYITKVTTDKILVETREKLLRSVYSNPVLNKYEKIQRLENETNI